jgi:phosphodiesterase/alkaline phosphatase D-like protein
MTDYGNSQGSPTLNVSHSLVVTGLQPETTYHFRARIRDNAGNLTIGSDATFQTTAPVAETKKVETLSLTDPEAFADTTTGKVSINWSTGTPATSQVLYGITEALGSESSEIKTLSYDHFVVLANLTPTTRYYYKVVSKDGAGNIQSSTIKYFMTPAGIGNAPAISSV